MLDAKLGEVFLVVTIISLVGGSGVLKQRRRDYAFQAALAANAEEAAQDAECKYRRKLPAAERADAAEAATFVAFSSRPRDGYAAQCRNDIATYAAKKEQHRARRLKYENAVKRPWISVTDGP